MDSSDSKVAPSKSQQRASELSRNVQYAVCLNQNQNRNVHTSDETPNFCPSSKMCFFIFLPHPFDKVRDVVLIKISLDIVLCPFGHGRHTAFAAADDTDLQGWKEIPQLCRKLHLWRAGRAGRWPFLAILGHCWPLLAIGP